MYEYRKKRVIQNILLVSSILAVVVMIAPSVLANIPSTHEIIDSIQSKTPDITQIKSPYTQEVTQYLLDNYKNQPRFKDCSYQQMIQYLDLGYQASQQQLVADNIQPNLNDPNVQAYMEQQTKLYNSLNDQFNNFHC